MGAATTFKHVFSTEAQGKGVVGDGDMYWCTADCGWITGLVLSINLIHCGNELEIPFPTGHTYTTYGPLLNGASQVIFEGVPTYPDPSRIWEIVDKFQVSHLYTAPTAIRSLMAAGDEYVTRTSRNSLKLLGTVGEPINPEAWKW